MVFLYIYIIGFCTTFLWNLVINATSEEIILDDKQSLWLMFGYALLAGLLWFIYIPIIIYDIINSMKH